MEPAAPIQKPDPLIDEVRSVRQALFDACGQDLARFVAELRAIEQQHAARVRVPKAAVQRRRTSQAAE